MPGHLLRVPGRVSRVGFAQGMVPWAALVAAHARSPKKPTCEKPGRRRGAAPAGRGKGAVGAEAQARSSLPQPDERAGDEKRACFWPPPPHPTTRPAPRPYAIPSSLPMADLDG